MGFLTRLLKGMCIGAGSFAPGVSGGTMAVVFGLYDKIMDFIANFYINFKKKLIFLLPVGIGGVIGFLLFNYAISYLLESYETQVLSFFIGLIAGSLPYVLKTANREGFKLRYLFFMACAAIISVVMIYAFGAEQSAASAAETNFFMLILYGAIIGFGSVVPGISSSAILLQCGAYYTITLAIRDMNIAILIPVGIGVVVGGVLFAKITTILLKKVYGYTYHTILGFVIGSIILIFPPLAFDISSLICILLMAAGFAGSYWFGKLQKD